MKQLLLLTAVAGLFAGMMLPADAQDRYGARPPLVVSPDLSAPWVMQLQRAPVGAQAPRGQRRLQGVTMRPAPQPRHVERREVRRAEPAGLQTSAYAAPRRSVVRPKRTMDPKYLPQTVAYDGPHKPGTVVIDTTENFLYLVEADGKARRYGVGTGKPGFEWAGTHKITLKREWPDWRPPAEMITRERKKGHILPVHMAGGPANPLGARALYLGSTLYRIHGTNQPWTIGGAVSSGCIRMRNEDVIDLYDRVGVGTKVVVI